MVLTGGYIRKEQLVEDAVRSSPTEMQILTQLTNELKDHGTDVKWRGRMLAQQCHVTCSHSRTLA